MGKELDYLRTFVPDIAGYYKNLYSGLMEIGLHQLVFLLSAALIFAGFVLVVNNIAVTGRLGLAAGQLVRIFIAALALGGYGSMIGGKTRQPEDAGAWKVFHAVYSSVYVDQNGLYARWLMGNGGPIRTALKRMNDASVRIAGYLGMVVGGQLVAQVVGRATPVGQIIHLLCEGGGGRGGEGRFSAASFAGALCSIKKKLSDLVDDIEKALRSAYSRTILAMVVLMSAHALVIYGATTLYVIGMFLLPLAAALYVYGRTEGIGMNLVGYMVGALVALPTSAVAFGAAAVVTFNTIANAWQGFAQSMTEIAINDKELEHRAKFLNVAGHTIDNLIKELEILRNNQLPQTKPTTEAEALEWKTKLMLSKFGQNGDIWFYYVEGNDITRYATNTNLDPQDFNRRPLPGQRSQAPGVIKIHVCTGTAASNIVIGGSPPQPTGPWPTNIENCLKEMDKRLNDMREAFNKVGLDTTSKADTLASRIMEWLNDFILKTTIRLTVATVMAFIMGTMVVVFSTRIASVIGEIRVGQGVQLPK